jgi:hypothetical protein
VSKIWDSLDKETFARFLASIIIAAWLVLIFLHYTEAPTLTNVVMIVIGYIYGSSTANKSKDDTIASQAKTLEGKTNGTS